MISLVDNCPLRVCAHQAERQMGVSASFGDLKSCHAGQTPVHRPETESLLSWRQRDGNGAKQH